MLISYRGHMPDVAPDVFVAPTAAVVGAVRLAPGSSVWFGAVLRGDQNEIRVGARSNVQDNAVVHADPPAYPGTPVEIGDDVTVGHAAVLHGCTIGDGAIVGARCVVLDGAVVGARTLLAAGSLVAPGVVLPAEVVAVGSPAKVVRDLTEEDLTLYAQPPAMYTAMAAEYRNLDTSTWSLGGVHR